MLTHLQRPLTGRYRAELFGYDPGPGDGGRPRRLSAVLGADAIVALVFLLSASAVLVGLATVALH